MHTSNAHTASVSVGMAGSEFEDDSTLSITASVAGILTFLVAIVGAVWLRISSLRSADTEYERVKTALKWYALSCAIVFLAVKQFEAHYQGTAWTVNIGRAEFCHSSKWNMAWRM